MRIAWAGLHTGEEPPITVWKGTGAIFFTGCNLRCPFCQNHQISWGGMGRKVDVDEAVRICLALQEAEAENISLITASHQVPQVATFIREAKRQGLAIPVVWNSSAYEKVSTLKELSDVVDVWLPDLKTVREDIASRLFGAADYPRVAKEAILWMAEQSPLMLHDVARGTQVREKITRGLIVRHLALPGFTDDTIETLQWLKDNVDARAAVSLMSQYTPSSEAKTVDEPLLMRTLNTGEIETLDDLVAAFDFQLLYKQEKGTEDAQLLPDFSQTAAFPSSLATPLWHWREGFVCR